MQSDTGYTPESTIVEIIQVLQTGESAKIVLNIYNSRNYSSLTDSSVAEIAAGVQSTIVEIIQVLQTLAFTKVVKAFWQSNSFTNILADLFYPPIYAIYSMKSGISLIYKE